MIHADQTLARRVERAGREIVVAYAKAHAALHPDADIEVLEAADGRAIFAGADSPMSQVSNLGMGGPIVEADVERLEDFYFRRKAKVQVVVCPMADPSVVEILGRRGYRAAEFENVLVRPMEHASDARTAAPDIEVSEVQPAEKNLYAEVIGPNFAPDGVLTPENRGMILAMFGMANGTAYLARIEGRAVGGGSLWIQDGVAWLAGGATLPPYRGRGVQAEVFRHRLDLARRSGCDLVEMGSLPGSTSQRNAERCGFRVMYTKVVMVRDPG